jgi:hypothetical protein
MRRAQEGGNKRIRVEKGWIIGNKNKKSYKDKC